MCYINAIINNYKTLMRFFFFLLTFLGSLDTSNMFHTAFKCLAIKLYPLMSCVPSDTPVYNFSPAPLQEEEEEEKFYQSSLTTCEALLWEALSWW